MLMYKCNLILFKCMIVKIEVLMGFKVFVIYFKMILIMILM